MPGYTVDPPLMFETNLVPGNSVPQLPGLLRQLGVLKFFTSNRFDHLTSRNGLPYASPTSEVLARFEAIKRLEHPNLCEQVEMGIGRLGQVYILSEHYPTTLSDVLEKGGPAIGSLPIPLIATQILQGLVAATRLGATFGLVAFWNLCPRNVLFAGADDRCSLHSLGQATVKLAGFGLGYLTRYGQQINFPLSPPGYTAPEAILTLTREWGAESGVSACRVDAFWPSPVPLDARADVWSFGLIVGELLTGKNLFLAHLSGLDGEPDPYDGAYRVLRDGGDFQAYVAEQLSGIDSPLADLAKLALRPDVGCRPFPEELLAHPALSCTPSDLTFPRLWHRGVPTFSFQTHKLSLDELRARRRTELLQELSLSDLVLLWRLHGGDLETFDGRGATLPDVLDLPDAVMRTEVGAVELGGWHPSDGRLTPEIIPLNLEVVTNRIASARSRPLPDYAPLDPEANTPNPLDSKGIPNVIYSAPVSLGDEEGPYLIYRRESDFDYQCYRLRLFRRLLSQLPASSDELRLHARWDIPPALRGAVWAGLLGVRGDYRRAYAAIDTSLGTSADRQIEVDVPRCHQYHPLLASSGGHARLRAILKAWVVSNEGLVYWQGLDSLCAPFLVLNFGDEALAFACLQRMLLRYLAQFFTPDNSAALQARLQAFQQVMAYHDPQLALHTLRLGFHPQLYAIPWFLTLFTHVLSLDKVFLLWDRFLAGPPALPLFVAVAIPHLFRATLLSSEFDECITLFSGCFPGLDVELCLATAFRFYYATPGSAVTAMVTATQPDPSPLDAGVQPEPAPWKVEGELTVTPWLSLQDFHRWRSQMLVIDVRDYEDYTRGHHAQSLHLEFPPEHHGYFQELLAPFVQQLRLRKWKCLVVVGDGDDVAQKLALMLMRMYLPRVAVLPADISRLVCATVSPPRSHPTEGLHVCQCSPHRFLAHSRTPARDIPLPSPSGPPAPLGPHLQPSPSVSTFPTTRGGGRLHDQPLTPHPSLLQAPEVAG
ncbi:hypothetical protein L0F63_003726 [Massospora cicadina]|nr:hypothetical protein L0F63_003726 [Massospora cicadina]